MVNVSGEEAGRKNLGTSSTGMLSLSLEVTEDVTAGFLKTNLDAGNSTFKNMLSDRLVQSIRQNDQHTVPLCVMSSGGGYFEVKLMEVDGQGERMNNGITPLQISFGEEQTDTVKFQSAVDECSLSQAIPVIIQLNGQESGKNLGTIYGRFNLLVKSE